MLQGGKIICDPEQFVIYKNEIAQTLLAISLRDNDQVEALNLQYERLEKVPAEITMEFLLLSHDTEACTHTLTSTSKVFPVNQLEPIFVWYSR